MKPFRIADLFCGAGGTSSGAVEAAAALGRHPEVTAVNHWDVAIATHTANHPGSRHLCTGVDAINPLELFAEGDLDLLWASPECTHHSVARGGKPINDQSRSTAWHVLNWIEKLLPPIVLIENVPEFATWGPVGSNGRPLKSRKGEIFQAWLTTLRSFGYKADYRLLCAADYGDPTTRTRLFVQAVRGRRRIVWPEKTHSKGGDLLASRQWAPARDIIDWTLPAGSIFERKKPLSPKTLARIEAGLRKFGLKGFTLPPLGETSPVFTSHEAGKVVQPFIVAWDHTSGGPGAGLSDINEPISTVVTKARHGVAEPFLVALRGSGGDQIDSTARHLDRPAPTITAGGTHLGLVEPHLLPQQSDGRLRPLSEPCPTVATSGAIALVEPFLVSFYGNGQAHDLSEPSPTVTCKDRFGLVRPVVELDGNRYLLDIRFRMLQPHELALAQGFPAGYRFTGNKTEQVKQIGNAVPRRLARALVAAAISQKEDVSELVEAEERKGAA
jgi:DNA (cytosine-5)-methyltransferase 1